jgi:hypothetical protein
MKQNKTFEDFSNFNLNTKSYSNSSWILTEIDITICLENHLYQPHYLPDLIPNYFLSQNCEIIIGFPDDKIVA